MVKKVQGTKSSKTGSAAPVQATRTIESGKVGGVEQVKQAETKGGAGRIQRSTRALTPEQQQELFHLIDEEAEKMFSAKGIPESKKTTVKGAVKMAVQASMVEEETPEKKKK